MLLPFFFFHRGRTNINRYYSYLLQVGGARPYLRYSSRATWVFAVLFTFLSSFLLIFCSFFFFWPSPRSAPLMMTAPSISKPIGNNYTDIFF